MLRGALGVIMKNTLPVEKEATTEGCKEQREDWVWVRLRSSGSPPTFLTPERSVEERRL